jgi:hypothetical protein
MPVCQLVRTHPNGPTTRQIRARHCVGVLNPRANAVFLPKFLIARHAFHAAVPMLTSQFRANRVRTPLSFLSCETTEQSHFLSLTSPQQTDDVIAGNPLDRALWMFCPPPPPPPPRPPHQPPPRRLTNTRSLSLSHHHFLFSLNHWSFKSSYVVLSAAKSILFYPVKLNVTQHYMCNSKTKMFYLYLTYTREITAKWWNT